MRGINNGRRPQLDNTLGWHGGDLPVRGMGSFRHIRWFAVGCTVDLMARRRQRAVSFTMWHRVDGASYIDACYVLSTD